MRGVCGLGRALLLPILSVFSLGSCLSSFLMVVVYRLPVRNHWEAALIVSTVERY